jgi:hypothetical protein
VARPSKQRYEGIRFAILEFLDTEPAKGLQESS